MVHEPSLNYISGRRAPIRSSIRGAILHHHINLVTSVLLQLKIPVLGLVLVVSSAATNIFHCNHQLCIEDYLWWWRSFLTSNSSALYLILYAAYYFINFNFAKPVTAVLFFGYALVGSFAVFVLTGTFLGLLLVH